MDSQDTPPQPEPDEVTPPRYEDVPDPLPDPGKGGRGSLDVCSLLVLFNGVAASLGGVYVTTSSVAITVTAGLTALLIALLIAMKK
ncbi:hypothetical protein [Nonomuraea sp. KM90]|uniref:hypothetical protein n=1 Tax=Nonomuraea sp. KM90 TaxID=3457428 RepID=UPI003FCCEBBE